MKSMTTAHVAPMSNGKDGSLANIGERNPSPEILTRTELAARLKCSLRHVDALQSRGMPVLRLGRCRRYVLLDVLAWIRRRNNG